MIGANAAASSTRDENVDRRLNWLLESGVVGSDGCPGLETESSPEVIGMHDCILERLGRACLQNDNAVGWVVISMIGWLMLLAGACVRRDG